MEIEEMFPLPGDRITCGKRDDLFRKQRVHEWLPLGMDTKNKGVEGIVEVEVFACLKCGKDRR